ncbi:DUF3325 domain-containing protein [Novosphingobium sp. BL-52-GroH]|uniref:DUF3325 domain-containing protein n=1 Tax=Novosphingobium sp. BL-52-GroH TaxID=3349877 RepID=UPI00384F7263
MIHILILMLALTGFIALLLGLQKHQQVWLRRKLPKTATRLLRACGFLSLALAYLSAGLAFSWGHGTVVWVGWLTIAAGLVLTVNVNRERIMPKVRR